MIPEDYIRQQREDEMKDKNIEIPSFITTIWRKDYPDEIPYLRFKCPACKQRYKLKDIKDIENLEDDE